MKVIQPIEIKDNVRMVIIMAKCATLSFVT